MPSRSGAATARIRSSSSASPQSRSCLRAKNIATGRRRSRFSFRTAKGSMKRVRGGSRRSWKQRRSAPGSPARKSWTPGSARVSDGSARIVVFEGQRRERSVSRLVGAQQLLHFYFLTQLSKVGKVHQVDSARVGRLLRLPDFSAGQKLARRQPAHSQRRWLLHLGGDYRKLYNSSRNAQPTYHCRATLAVRLLGPTRRRSRSYSTRSGRHSNPRTKRCADPCSYLYVGVPKVSNARAILQRLP